MGKTKLSLITIAMLSASTFAQAETDLKTTGQAVAYYQTMDSSGAADLFDNGANSRANVGLQVKTAGELVGGIEIGVKGTVLSTLGLDQKVIGKSMQTANSGEFDGAMISEAYVKKMEGNTKLTIGRQELPKSVSPFAFSEGWNLFKNTFDAAVACNKDIKDTKVIAAYVSKGNGALVKTPGLVDLGNFKKLGEDGAYMLTIANTSSKMFQPTATYYKVSESDYVWGDLKINPSIPVKFGLQGGQADKTKALGAQAVGKLGPVKTILAYTKVGKGTAKVHNLGTGVKTPLYTQMILNQGAIKTDNDTVMLKGITKAGPGKLIAMYASTKSDSAGDYGELDVIYKFDLLGTKMLAAYVMQDFEKKDTNNMLRVWSRYNF
ncbi:MAG TPA: hypothetical protein ENK82_02290 [Campylobacterales bacterium]|nr:hypothetical protein [Campylobacterales bacterium]HHS92154.1 hypothetical protein [Campylobacterales bacterium]